MRRGTKVQVLTQKALQHASDKAPTMMLMQLKELKKEAAQAAQAGWGTEMLSDDVMSHDAAAGALIEP
jgi:hypothetical protein